MKALFLSLLVLFASFPIPNDSSAKTCVEKPAMMHALRLISRADLLKAIHNINASLSFTKGKDIDHLPHFFANQKGKFSIAIIGTESSVNSVKLIVIIDNNNNQNKYLQIVENISELLSGTSGKDWIHKNIAHLTMLTGKDFHSVLSESTYRGKLNYLSKNKLLTVEYKRK